MTFKRTKASKIKINWKKPWAALTVENDKEFEHLEEI